MTGPSARLRELGIELPAVASPAGAYIPARRSGTLVFTAGQLPIIDGTLQATGKVGAEVDVDRARELLGFHAETSFADGVKAFATAPLRAPVTG